MYNGSITAYAFVFINHMYKIFWIETTVLTNQNSDLQLNDQSQAERVTLRSKFLKVSGQIDCL